MAARERENDVRGRFTLWHGRDSHDRRDVRHATAEPYALSATALVAGRADAAESGATPQAEGLVRARGQVCFHTVALALQGSLPSNCP